MTDLFVDGGVIKSNPSKLGGTWAYFLIENETIIKQGSGIVTPKDVGLPKVSNNLTELLAAIRGLEAVPDGWDGTIHTDSMVTWYRITNGNSFNGIPKWLIDLTVKLRRNRKWIAKLVKGHPSKKELEQGFHVHKNGTKSIVSKWNCACDVECTRLADTLIGKNKSDIFKIW